MALQTNQRDSPPVVVITGVSAGVGRATALAFARRGWAVAGLARGRRGLEGAQRDIEAAGACALMLSADVADADAVKHAAQQVVDAWGRIDVWVNNAMTTIFAPISEITPEEFKRVTEVTYLGQVHGTLAALLHMKGQGFGTIVQVGSALAYRSIPLQSAYCAAKAAARGFTDSLRSELIHDHSPIRLTMVHLPAMNTPQFDWARSRLPRQLQPVPPIYDPEAAAEAIYTAAQEAPRELWVGAPTAKAIGGTMLAPGFLDHFLARRAWDGQMTPDSAAPRADNLFEPVDEDRGVRGRFTHQEKRGPANASASSVRLAVLAAGAAIVGLLVLGRGRSR